MKRRLLTMIFIALGTLLYAQQVAITGRVTDVSGVPLPGVNIVEKGTRNGTTTGSEGEYTIAVQKNTILVYSYIGYVTVEKEVANDQTIDIELKEEAFQLNDVVVTALGITQEKKTIGYSTQEVKMEELKSINTQNVGNLLTGKVAGLAVSNPTGIFQAPALSLRGKNPLIVIDDIPVETNFYDVPSGDIADITILKGTTASALYGARGRNGAILISTKSAKSEGLEITLSNSTMITAGFTVFPETQTEYGNGSNGQYEFWDGQDGGISDGDMIWGPKFEAGVMVPQWNSPIYDNVTGETTPWWGDVSGTKYDDKSRYSRVPTPWKYHNNLKDFMETGYVSTTDFSIAYKGLKSKYKLSGSYSKQKGQVPNSYLHTGGINFTSTFDLRSNLKLDSKLSYNKVYSPNYPRYGYGPKNHMYTILIWMGDDVNGQDLKDHMYIPGQEGYRQANFNYAWYNNVYFAANELNQVYDSDQLNGQMKLTWEITRNLIVQGRTSAVKKMLFEDRASPKSYLNYGDPRDGDYKIWNSDWLTLDNDILATYRKQLTSNFNLTVNAGGSSYYRKYHNEYNATDGLIVPYVYSLNNTKGNVKASNAVEERAVRSVYGTVDFDFYDALFLNIAARNDWSSTLPVSNSSYFYPSISLSTVVSNLIDMPKAFDYLKVFGSWAEVSSDLNPYKISSYYSNYGSYNGQTQLTYPSTLINPDIEPEKSTSFELGLSSSFLKNRFSFDFTYYNVVDENQIIDLAISQASGFDGRKVNGNQYTTNGYEVTLNASPVKNNNLRWDITANWDTRVKKLTEIYGGAEKYGNYSKGERIDNYYATTWLKSADGQLILSEATGLPVKNPYQQSVGHTEPDWRFGLQNRIKYKKMTLDVDIDGVWGGVIRSLTVEKMWWGGKHPYSTEWRDEEYAAGAPVYVPKGVNVVSGELTTDVDGNVISDTRSYQPNETKVSWQTWCQNYPYRAKVTESESQTFANIFDRSFAKLRRVSVSYDITQLVGLKGLKNAEVTAYGYNLLILKKAEIIDPDYGNDDNLQDPSTRYVGMSLKLTF
ncbi:MAG: SusC/RagA family TonB-linked outer membrane protein [Bacteroidales bacterium]|nr:SusC/RagA family TonB-linked outer membrane protein [Bacteroidales bacterium]